MDGFRYHIPDPIIAREQAQEQLEAATRPIHRAPIEHLLERIRLVDRPRQIRLSLDEVLTRTLENSFAVRVSSYNPAIETTRVVEAEAAFDASFFLNINNNKQDIPSASVLQGTNIQRFDLTGGVRKLLPSGMQVETSLSIIRSSNNFRFQTLNPEWFSQFVVQFRQPMLRGFGLDFNRSQIRLQKLGKRRATQEFKRQIRDTLRSVEEGYWRLVQARRNLVVSARLLARFERIYSFLYERRKFDVFKIQLADTNARLEASKANFVRVVADVQNAEDNLISLMNDPTLDLADDIEIIPLDFPVFHPLILDWLAEVQTALDNRAELAEAKLAIDSAKIQIGVAKNQAMPRLDVLFRYSVDGLGESADDAFDEVTKNDYHEYFVGIEFEVPIGNRGPRAALQRTRLQHAQAIATLKLAFEQVIQDVNVSIREVQVTFDQIEPSLQSVIATKDQVDSIEARAEKKDFLTLSNELSTEQALAQSRSTLLSALIDYNVAIIDLERAKGTLLKYNNVELVLAEPEPIID